jgi:hypothetical protein
VNDRQYKGVNRAVKWINRDCSVYSLYCFCLFILLLFLFIVLLCLFILLLCLFILLLCLFILLLCLFILLICLPHCIVWHSFYCFSYLIVLSDIPFTALFTPLYWTIQWDKKSSKVKVRQYNEVSKAVKWMSDNTMG